MPATKEIVLRAFRITQNPQISTPIESVTAQLYNRIHASLTEHRKMRLSEQDPESEEDFISTHWSTNTESYGIMMRIKMGGNTTHIPESLFQEEGFSVSQLQENASDFYGIYKDHYYYFMDDNYLIVSLKRPATIKRFSVYFNWLLNNIDYEFNPVVVTPENTSLKEVESILFTDPVNRSRVATLANRENRSIVIKTLELIRPLLVDANSISDHELSQIISARLLVTMRKPQEMTEDDYQRIFGAIFRPIADTENISLKLKNKGTLKGEDFCKVKSVNIDLTDTGQYIDQQVFQEMRSFLGQLYEEARR